MSATTSARWSIAASDCTAARSVASLPCEESSDAPGNQCADVREDAREGQAGRSGQVSRLPHRIKLLLVPAQSLKVVEVLSMSVQQSAHAIPERGNGAHLESGQRSHAKRHSFESVFRTPEHQRNTEVFHHAGWRITAITHQVERQLTAVARPDVREGDDPVVDPDDDVRKMHEILLVESSKRKTLFTSGLGRQ